MPPKKTPAPIPAPEDEKKVRLTLEMPAETGHLLDGLMKRTKSTSKTEVIRKALALLDAASTARAEGKKVGAVEPGQKLAVEFVGL